MAERRVCSGAGTLPFDGQNACAVFSHVSQPCGQADGQRENPQFKDTREGFNGQRGACVQVSFSAGIACRDSESFQVERTLCIS